MKKVNRLLRDYLTPCFLIFTTLTSYGQSEDNIESLSLEELMSIKIFSVSKKEETQFNTPLSSSVITKEEIAQSGASSIPEALRLVPGVIVREQSNGNFDVHIRGLDNIPPGTFFPISSNSITLVMIDSRPVYNYFGGGTFWETLPIDLDDIEQIEVVKGASSALYGPNAVAGVINLITKKFDPSNKMIAGATVELGSQNSKIARARAGYSFENGLSAIVSANLLQKDRFTTDYYSFGTGTLVSTPSEVTNIRQSTLSTPDIRYPDTSLGIDKQGLNVFLDYSKGDISAQLNAGIQDSETQKVYVDTQGTPLTTNQSNSQYVDFHFKYKGLRSQVSSTFGDQSTNGISSFDYDFNTLDAVIEYEINLEKLTIRPGFNYRNAVYDGVFLGGEQSISTYAGSVYTSYTPFEKTRFIGAFRLDQYNTPDRIVPSYQLAATQQITDRLILRASVGQAKRTPFMLDNFTSFITPGGPNTTLGFFGNKDLDLLVSKNYESGLRYQINDRIQLDVELFITETENYSDIVFDNISVEDGTTTVTNRYQNLEVSARQTGATVGINYVPTNKVQMHGFVSWQNTRIFDHATVDESNTPILVDLDNKSTPSFYGGLYVNYLVFNQLNLNISSYFYDEQTFVNISGTDKINGKLLINFKASYDISDNLSLYVNGKNISGLDHREFAFADRIGASIMGGLKLQL